MDNYLKIMLNNIQSMINHLDDKDSKTADYIKALEETCITLIEKQDNDRTNHTPTLRT